LYNTGKAEVMSERVYISYPSKDSKVVGAIVAALEANGVHCWFADRDLSLDQELGTRISDQIKSAKAIVLFFNDRANESEWIEREVELAVEHDVPVIVMTVDDPVELNGRLIGLLSQVQWLRVRTVYEIDSALAAITRPSRQETNARR
jgi:hypothetical protein